MTMSITSGTIPGSVQRIGYFDDDNGMFFENDGGQKSVVLRSTVNNVMSEQRILQSNWNIDTCDSSGVSGFDLDMEKANIYIIDFQWLGTGRIRYAIGVSGVPIECHQILNENINDYPYISMPNLPIRWENFNKNDASHGSSVNAICGTVVSEGGDVPIFTGKAADNGVTAASVTSTQTPILAVRTKEEFKRVALQPINIEAAITANAVVFLEAYVGGTVSGGAWVSNDEVTEKNVTGTSYNTFGATKIYSGYLVQQERTTSEIINSLIFAASNFRGDTREPIVLCATKIGSSSISTYGAILYREIA
jgi:hypothetical protein